VTTCQVTHDKADQRRPGRRIAADKADASTKADQRSATDAPIATDASIATDQTSIVF
jgi:hypothetical protein